MRFYSRQKNPGDTAVADEPHSPSDIPHTELSKPQLKRATRARQSWALLTSCFLVVAVIFLILVEIAGTSNKDIINNWYFIRLDLSNVVPSSVPNSALLNTIAQTLGLHDFYQVGLWGFCEGNNGEGVTFCSEPRTMYWFDPVSILRDELFAGASINLPADINDTLDLVRLVSHWMFGLFLTGTVLSFVLIFLMPISLYTRWLALLTSLLALLNALIVTAASIIATVLFIIFRQRITGVEELNVGADIGITLFVFMWIASGFAIAAWLVQTGLCCCCASRRDVKSGRKKGNEKAYDSTRPRTTGAPGQKKRFWQRR